MLNLQLCIKMCNFEILEYLTRNVGIHAAPTSKEFTEPNVPAQTCHPTSEPASPTPENPLTKENAQLNNDAEIGIDYGIDTNAIHIVSNLPGCSTTHLDTKLSTESDR